MDRGSQYINWKNKICRYNVIHPCLKLHLCFQKLKQHSLVERLQNFTLYKGNIIQTNLLKTDQMQQSKREFGRTRKKTATMWAPDTLKAVQMEQYEHWFSLHTSLSIWVHINLFWRAIYYIIHINLFWRIFLWLQIWFDKKIGTLCW